MRSVHHPYIARGAAAYFWAVIAVCAATALFSILRYYLDKGQASLLYLPVVIACAIYFGFGAALLAAVLSFFAWNFFFLPPFYTLTIADPKDWLSLAVFLVAAVTTARLASQAREQTALARAREAEIAILFEASETLSSEVSAARVISVLSDQLRTLCHASECVVWQTTRDAAQLSLLSQRDAVSSLDPDDTRLKLALAVVEHKQIIGFDRASTELWNRALGSGKPKVSGAYVPLQAENEIVGVLYVGARQDDKLFSPLDQRLILTLANHVAVVIAREALAGRAAQAEALRESDLLKDSLLSMVSHELRSPLAAIKVTATELIARPGGSDIESKEALQAINSEADRLAALVGNLLDLSRLEAGAWRPEKDWCDIGEIVGTALDRLPRDQANRVTVSIEEDTPLIKADYTQIALVVTNLLQNAVKYTPSGSSIELVAAPDYDGSDEAPNGALIRVRDYGTGIAPGDEEAIFTRFFRSSVHQKGAARGTGLGLALCRAIVRAHDGRIWAFNSAAGEPHGAVLCVFLPLE